MIKHGHLDVPVIGVAKAGWNLEQFRQRARDSVTKHGGLDAAAFAKFSGLLRYVDGDYSDPATFQSLRNDWASATPGPLSRHSAGAVSLAVEQLGKSGCAAAPASLSRSHLAAIWRRRSATTARC